MTESDDVGTIQYMEWLILNDRVQPLFIAGVFTSCSWGSPLAKLTVLSTVFQYNSSTGLGVLECTGNCLV